MLRNALAFFNLARVEPRHPHRNELILFSGIWFLTYCAGMISAILKWVEEALKFIPFINLTFSFVEEDVRAVSPILDKTFLGISGRAVFLVVFPLLIGLYAIGHEQFHTDRGFYAHKKRHVLFSLIKLAKEQAKTKTDFVYFVTVSFFYGLFLVVTYLPVYIGRKLSEICIYWLEFFHNLLVEQKISFIVINRQVGNKEVIMHTLESIKEIFPELELRKTAEYNFSAITNRIGPENFWRYLMLYEGAGVSIFLTDKGVSLFGKLYDTRLAYLVLYKLNEDDFLDSRNDLLMAVEYIEKDKRRLTWERMKQAILTNSGIPIDDMRKIIANGDYPLEDVIPVFDKFVS